MRPNQKRVLIALGWYDYRVHRGIEKFAQEHHWHVSANPTREKIIPWGWEGDGILAWLGAGDDLAECIAETGLPNLSVLPLGLASSDHVSQLSPTALRNIIEQARRSFDMVLIDTCLLYTSPSPRD